MGDHHAKISAHKERFYQAKIMQAIRANYPSAFVWKAQAGPYSCRGIPDICAIIHGRFFALEVKRPDIGRLSKIQEKTIREIQRAGGIAAVVSYPEQALAIIQNALSNPPEKSQT